MRVDLNQKKRVDIAPPKPVRKAINSPDPTKYGAVKIAPQIQPTTPSTQVSQFPTESPISLNEQINNYLAKPAYDMSQNNSGIVGTVGKSLANDLKSLLRFGKGTVDFINPVETAKKLKDIPSAFTGWYGEMNAAQASINAAKKMEDRVRAIREAKGQQYTPNAPLPNLLNAIPDFKKAAVESITPPAFQKAFQGMGYEAVQSVAEDPYQLAPLFLIGKQFLGSKTGRMITPKGEVIPEGVKAPKGSIEQTYGATKIGNAIDTAISGTAKVVTKPVKYATSGTIKMAKNLAEYGVSQTTGLSPKTIETIIENPKNFTAKEASKYTRDGIGEEVKTQIDKRLNDLSDTGKAYEVIRNTPGNVKIPSEAVKAVFDKYKIGVDDNGRIITTQESLPLSATDQSGLQSFIDTFNTTELSNNAFLNARTALSNLAKYDATKTSASTMLSRELRSVYDYYGKEQIPGLKNLDTVYSQERNILQQIKKDYLKPDGTFKDNAVSKIANLNKEGRQLVLNRLENIYPGISKKIQLLNAFEDIQHAKGQKVGTYARAGLGVFGAATMNIPAIIAAILSSPEIAVQIIRGWARLKNLPPIITNTLIKKVSDILNTDITETNIGLSIKDVKSIDSLTKNEMIEAIDYIRLKKPYNQKIEENIGYLAEKYNIKSKTNGAIANELEKLVEQTKTKDTSGRVVKKQSKSEDTLAQEARKYKSADEFVKANETPKTVNVWRKSRFSDGGAKVDYPVIRREDNITLYQGGEGGQHWTPDKKYAKQFGNVKEKTGSFYQIDNGNRMTNVYVEAPTKSQLTDIWNKANKTK